MGTVKLILFIVMVIWYLIYIIFNIYLYLNDSKMYDLEYPVDVQNIDRTPQDLSLMMYKKIKVEAFVATIINLINMGVIKIRRENDDFILMKNNVDNLSKSNITLLQLLFDEIGDGKEVSLNKVGKFCNKQARCSIFLMNYDIWKKLIVVESNKKDLFEPKLEYRTVKLIQRIGLLLFITNLVLNITFKYVEPIGLFIVVPAFFILLYFYKISKLTKEYTQEYYGWLNYRRNVVERKVNIDNKHLEHAVVLRCIGYIENTNQKEFIQLLDSTIRKCYTNAFLNGSRSLFRK